MKRFGYLCDPLFLLCCCCYVLNRLWIKPHFHSAFFHNWFNDLLLIPCALPPLLLVHDWLGLRARNAPPTALEIISHLAGWSVLFEVIGPHIMRTTGDPWDVVAYAAGAVPAWLWWRWFYPAETPARSVNFDPLAPHYRWMEWILAGPKLQRCRTAFLGSIPAPRNVLLLGEGNGRFLTELLRAHPGAHCICVDASARMLDCARARLQSSGLAADSVEFVHADILNWTPPQEHFDLIVSHFFLDCFRADQLAQLLPRLAAAAAPDAKWLLADFQEPREPAWAKWRARLILRSMYWFFGFATRLPAAHLTSPDGTLENLGFILRERRCYDWGLLHTDLWGQSAPETLRAKLQCFVSARQTNADSNTLV